jgi:acyl-CoA thioesterase-1
MIKKILIVVSIVVLLIVSVEIVKLLQLKSSVGRYADYWKNTTTKSGDFTYVVLGDSAAQGIGANKPERGYVGLLAKHIEQTTGKKVRIINLSVTGATINDVLHNQLPELKNYQPDLLTVEIGSNDVYAYDAAKFRKDYEELASKLPAGTPVANIPYFGGRIRKNDTAIEASQYIADAAHKYNLKLVDLQIETREKQSILNYSADYFHPSNRGYRNWESAFWKVI